MKKKKIEIYDVPEEFKGGFNFDYEMWKENQRVLEQFEKIKLKQENEKK